MATLVYHSGALGDFITILPSLSFYRQISNESEIVLLGKKKFGDIALQYGYVDRVIDIESSTHVYLFNERCTCRIKSFLDNFSSAFFFTHKNMSLLLHALTQDGLLVMHHRPFPDNDVHIVDYHLSLFNTIKTDKQPPAYASFIGKNAFNYKLKNIAIPYVAIAPGSGSSLKNWPIENFRHIADTFRKRGVHVCWILGEADQGLQFPSTDTTLLNCELEILISVFNNCSLYIGNDSGITHLAAASHCPVIALFGPSNPKIWSPKGPCVKIIFKEMCQPCHLKNFPTKKCTKECLNSISTDEVFSAVKDVSSLLT